MYEKILGEYDMRQLRKLYSFKKTSGRGVLEIVVRGMPFTTSLPKANQERALKKEEKREKVRTWLRENWPRLSAEGHGALF
jgi:hypothetical protein